MVPKRFYVQSSTQNIYSGDSLSKAVEAYAKADKRFRKKHSDARYYPPRLSLFDGRTVRTLAMSSRHDVQLVRPEGHERVVAEIVRVFDKRGRVPVHPLSR